MRNLNRKTLILIFILTSLLCVAFGQTSVNVFNTSIQLTSPVKCSEYPSGYPLSIGASHLRLVEYNLVSRPCLAGVFNSVKGVIDGDAITEGIPVIGEFFTSRYDNDSMRIQLAETHAFCFGMQQNNMVTLYYYEKQPDGLFKHIPALDTRLNSIADDQFISLHYASFAPGSFPLKSTIFSFIADDLGYMNGDDSTDLTVGLSKDYRRVAGLFSRGMADSLVLAGCDQPNAGYSNCGGKCGVTQPNTHCTFVMDTHGNGSNECVTGNDRCAAGAMERRVNDLNLNIGVPVKFKMMRDFRDKFMARYCEGRKYIGFYYVFSKYAKMNIDMLWQYGSILPDLYEAMNNLSDESSDKVIVTASMKEKVLSILNAHKDVGDSYFHSILIDVEKDLEKFTGLKRSEIIAMLSPYGSCDGGRQANADLTHASEYFATVYDNPGRNEIIVNYSVSGSKIKFELFNTTARLVTSINDAPSQQKFSISTSTLDPGIYMFRITSDSGYEKTGKVVVVK